MSAKTEKKTTRGEIRNWLALSDFTARDYFWHTSGPVYVALDTDMIVIGANVEPRPDPITVGYDKPLDEITAQITAIRDAN
jgi:hypothetical protein